MSMQAVYRNFDVYQYSGTDLERFGKGIVKHVLNHVGMIRYVQSDMKVFDLTAGALGYLMDATNDVVDGLSVEKGLQDYQKRIQDLLNLIENFDLHKTGSNSVRRSLHETIAIEIKKFKRETINFEEMYEV